MGHRHRGPGALRKYGHRLALAVLVLELVACSPLVTAQGHPVYSLPRHGVDRFVRVRGHTVHYVEAGAGRPILLIPGAFTTYRAWNRVLPGLATAYRVLAVDYLGVGDSDKPETDFRYTVEEQADVMAEMLRSLGLSRVHVVGASYGGAVALNLAARYPDLVDRVVSVEGGALIAPEVLNYTKTWGLLNWPILGDIIWGFMQSGLFDGISARSVMGAAWDGLSPEDRREIHEVIAANIRTSTKASCLGIYLAITRRIDFTDVLERAPVRVLYLYGEASKYRAVAEMNVRWFSERKPRIEIVSFPGGIHDLHLQYPQDVTTTILRFLGPAPGGSDVAEATGPAGLGGGDGRGPVAD